MKNLPIGPLSLKAVGLKIGCDKVLQRSEFLEASRKYIIYITNLYLAQK